MTENVTAPAAESGEERGESRLELAAAILIAIAILIGALIAWRASVADDASGDADFAGLHAALNANETRALSSVNAYENYGAFTTYWRNRRLGDLIVGDQEQASEQEAILMEQARADAHDLATANQTLFSSKYLDRQGRYGLQRQIGEMWADAAREKDLNPDPQFAEADNFRSKSLKLLLAVLVLTIAPVFYSLIESVEGKTKIVLAAFGTLFLLAGTLFGALVEFGVL